MFSMPGLGAVYASRGVAPGSDNNVVLSCLCNGNMQDKSISHHAFTLYNGAGFNADPALVLDGVDDYAQTPVSSDFAFGLADFSVSLETQKTSLTGKTEYALTTDTSNGSNVNGWGVQFYGSYVCFAMTNNTWLEVVTTIADGLWHKWEFKRTNGVFYILKDDVVIGQKTVSVNLLALGPFGVGRNANVTTYPFKGLIRNIVITRPGYSRG